MPESRADVHFGGEWTLCALGEDFFMAEDGQGEADHVCNVKV